ncbi:hypothetical protein FKW77_000826 [Venturia effusa]|uniref:Uncharacterized protein n=1 Tax=Venturia effusa TaxID=50376 RepID=A0A517LRI2_9PEZI|nr:hypothetical protein FKW77_000826 [Venturia effusa]
MSEDRPYHTRTQRSDDFDHALSNGTDSKRLEPDNIRAIHEARLAAQAADSYRQAENLKAAAIEVANANERTRQAEERRKKDATWARTTIMWLLGLLLVMVILFTVGYQPGEQLALVGRDLGSFRQDVEVSANIRAMKGCARVLSTATSREVAKGQDSLKKDKSFFAERPELEETLERIRTAISTATDLATKGGRIDNVCSRIQEKMHRAFDQARLQIYQRQPHDIMVKLAERPPNYRNFTIQPIMQHSDTWLESVIVPIYSDLVTNPDHGLLALLNILPDEGFRESPYHNPDWLISVWINTLNGIASSCLNLFSNSRYWPSEQADMGPWWCPWSKELAPNTKLIASLMNVFAPDHGAIAAMRLYSRHLMSYRAEIEMTVKHLRNRHAGFRDLTAEGGRLRSCSHAWEKRGCLLYYDQILIKDYQRVAGWLCGEYDVRMVRIKKESGIVINDIQNVSMDPVLDTRLGSKNPYTTLEIHTQRAFDDVKILSEGFWAARNDINGRIEFRFMCETLTLNMYWVNNTYPYAKHEDRHWRSKKQYARHLREEHDAKQHPERFGC